VTSFVPALVAQRLEEKFSKGEIASPVE
jgi:hypothetical protein